MSERIEIIRATFDDLITRDSVETLLASITGDVVLKNTVPQYVPFAGEYRGRDGILDYFARVATVLEFHSLQAAEYYESGDRVVVLGNEVLRIKSTGEECPSDWCTVFRFRGNLISEISVIEDHSPLCVELLKQEPSPRQRV